MATCNKDNFFLPHNFQRIINDAILHLHWTWYVHCVCKSTLLQEKMAIVAQTFVFFKWEGVLSQNWKCPLHFVPYVRHPLKQYFDHLEKYVSQSIIAPTARNKTIYNMPWCMLSCTGRKRKYACPLRPIRKIFCPIRKNFTDLLISW